MLGNNVDPGDITWIMPRDSWMLDRKNIQPGIHTPATLVGAANQTKAIAESTSVDDMFERLHACGQLLRFDDNVKPTMYRCATVTEVELQHLRTVRNIVRNGRVQAITSSEIVLDNASVATSAATLHIDHHHRDLGHHRQPDRLLLEREARPGCDRHRAAGRSRRGAGGTSPGGG